MIKQVNSIRIKRDYDSKEIFSVYIEYNEENYSKSGFSQGIADHHNLEHIVLYDENQMIDFIINKFENPPEQFLEWAIARRKEKIYREVLES